MSGTEEKNDRATKKVKSREVPTVEEEVVMEDVSGSENSLSFREALMSNQGFSGDEEFLEDEWLDEDLVENRWYKDDEEMEHLQHVIQGAIPEILISDEELDDWSTNWRRTLIVNVLGKRVNFRALENKLNRVWARVGKIKIIDMPRGYYAVKFEKDADYRNALFQGPWMVADHYILVQRWRRNFLKSATKEQKVAVWVRIPELPLELYNDIFLKRLGSSLGSMLKIDKLTSIHSRGQFARICVEVNLAKPVVPQVMVRGELLNLEYEGLHTICFHCGVYGHRENECLMKLAAEAHDESARVGEKNQVGVPRQGEPREEGDKEEGPNCRVGEQVNNSCQEHVGEDESGHVSANDDDLRPHFGPWMVVSKPRRNRKKVTAMGKKKAENFHQRSTSEEGAHFHELANVEIPAKEPLGASKHVGTKDSNQMGVSNGKEAVGPDETRPIPSKVRNIMGGKNPQTGPSVRDIKKAARSNGLEKNNIGPIKSSKMKAGQAKETFHPYGTGTASSSKGKLGLVKVHDPMALEKINVQRTAPVKVDVQIIQSSHETLDTVGLKNYTGPVLMPLDSTKDVVMGSPSNMEIGSMKSVVLLSEHKTPTSSK